MYLKVIHLKMQNMQEISIFDNYYFYLFIYFKSQDT